MSIDIAKYKFYLQSRNLRAQRLESLLQPVAVSGSLEPRARSKPRQCAGAAVRPRTIASWQPLSLRPLKRLPKVPRLRRVR
jgi:hypothetical protein